MRIPIVLSLLVVLASAGAASAGDEKLDMAALDLLAERFQFFDIERDDSGQPIRFVYGDERQHVHVLAIEDGVAVRKWETTTLGSRVSGLAVTDLDRDGATDIVITTKAGRIIVYQMGTFELLWENLQDPFPNITCLAVANIDRDPQQELIFLAGGRMFFYDGIHKNLEWESQDTYEAKIMLLGNVDNDEQLEIILNTGVVLDSRFYTVELRHEPGFGDRIRLLDLNGDGIPEIVGESTDRTISVYDIYAEREMW